MFQSPEGDSLFFYEEKRNEVVSTINEFQSPEGDSLFFYLCAQRSHEGKEDASFSPPKGIRCFSTMFADNTLDKINDTFQSPEGDSLFFYTERLPLRSSRFCRRFSPPKGIRCFST